MKDNKVSEEMGEEIGVEEWGRKSMKERGFRKGRDLNNLLWGWVGKELMIRKFLRKLKKRRERDLWRRNGRILNIEREKRRLIEVNIWKE